MTQHARLFDDFGVPAGDQAEGFWRGLASSMFTRLEQDGWDQPNSLWIVLGPTATASVMDVGVVHEMLSARDPNGVNAVYAIERLIAYDDNGRRTLPGIIAPQGTAAIMLISEAWKTSQPVPEDMSAADARESLRHLRLSEKQRPSQSPDRVEMRNMLIMEPDGTRYLFAIDRGQDPSNPDALDMVAGDGIAGVLPDLVRRCFRLPVEPEVTVGEVLGTVVMLGMTQMLNQNPGRESDSPAVLYAVMQMMAQLIDALDTGYDADPRDPELAAVFHGTPNLSAQLDAMVRFEATGPLFAAARKISRTGWTEFFDLPGATRWLRTDDQGTVLTADLRDWYGIGHLSRFIEERLPSWGTARNGLQGALGDLTPFVVSSLVEVGWAPRQPR